MDVNKKAVKLMAFQEELRASLYPYFAVTKAIVFLLVYSCHWYP